MKLQRNDLCHCGSGKKYKKCCLGTKSKHVLNVIDLVENFRRIDLMKTVAALQLLPLNHGKNIRLELFAHHVFKAKLDAPVAVYKDLCNVFENDFEEHYLEDPVSSFFTENIIFYGGNYIVFPGIDTNGTKILNTYLEAIFIRHNELPKDFKDKLELGIILLLALSNSIAKSAKLDRFIYEENDEIGNIYIPSEAKLEELKQAVVFSISDINSILHRYNIPREVLDDFVVNQDEVKVEDYHPDYNVLLIKPIVFEDNQYVFLLPTAVVHCLIKHVEKLTISAGFEKEVTECYFNLQWEKLVRLLYDMNWQITDIELPEKDSKLNIKEAIFRFDNDKMAYVHLIKNRSSDADVIKDEYYQSSNTDMFSQRTEEIFSFLNKLNEPFQYRYLRLGILGESGQNFSMTWDKPNSDNQSLFFILADLEKLVYDGNINELTLWKFAKAHQSASGKTKFPFVDMLDLYTMYKDNWGSLLSPEYPPIDFMHIGLGTSNDFGRAVVKKRDEHAVLRMDKGGYVHTAVKRHKEYAPIYSERDYFLASRLLIENFDFPLWIINTQAKSLNDKNTVNEYIEGIIFWLYKCSPSVVDNLNILGELPIEVSVELDSSFLEGIEVSTPLYDRPEAEVDISANGRSIKVIIPKQMAYFFRLSNNEGERLIIKAILKAFNILLKIEQHPILTDSIIELALDTYIPLGNAKMLLLIDSSKNWRLDNRWLFPCRYIEDADITIVLDNIFKYTGKTLPLISEEIEDVNEKNKLCNKIVAGLIEELNQRLKLYDSTDLLRWLLEFNEAYIQYREFREIRIPAKIACFSDFPSEVENLQNKDKNLVSTAISTRCLIEFVSAEPTVGNKLMNHDDLQAMMALMNEIIQWGMISDSIVLKMDDPIMEILPSGRIHVDDSFVRKGIIPYGKARAESNIEGYIEAFENQFNSGRKNDIDSTTTDMKEIDLAFYQEWGITMNHILDIKDGLIKMIMDNNSSIIEIEEDIFIEAMKKNKSDITEESIRVGLDLLCLRKRDSILKSPEGFSKDDIYPWRYNRALSFIRRPIIKLVKVSDGKTYYYSGFRHLWDSMENLASLLFKGRLRAKDGGALSSVLAKINAQKGDYYRDQLCQWFKTTPLRIIDHEVTICVNGHLVAEKDYGDIDIMAIDDENKIVYSIECKDTVEARVIHEMKTELDKYLGRNGNTAMIEKHVQRHKWLLANQDKLSAFISKQGYSIKSIVVSAQDIPIIYLAAETLPLPMLSFNRLKREGLVALR